MIFYVKIQDLFIFYDDFFASIIESLHICYNHCYSISLHLTASILAQNQYKFLPLSIISYIIISISTSDAVITLTHGTVTVLGHGNWEVNC